MESDAQAAYKAICLQLLAPPERKSLNGLLADFLKTKSWDLLRSGLPDILDTPVKRDQLGSAIQALIPPKFHAEFQTILKAIAPTPATNPPASGKYANWAPGQQVDDNLSNPFSSGSLNTNPVAPVTAKLAYVNIAQDLIPQHASIPDVHDPARPHTYENTVLGSNAPVVADAGRPYVNTVDSPAPFEAVSRPYVNTTPSGVSLLDNQSPLQRNTPSSVSVRTAAPAPAPLDPPPLSRNTATSMSQVRAPPAPSIASIPRPAAPQASRPPEMPFEMAPPTLPKKTNKPPSDSSKSTSGVQPWSTELYMAGMLTRGEAEKMLRAAGWTEGLFLIREKGDEFNSLVLSLVHDNQPLHLLLEQVGAKPFTINGDPFGEFHLVEDLIECLRSLGPSYQYRLVKPIGLEE